MGWTALLFFWLGACLLYPLIGAVLTYLSARREDKELFYVNTGEARAAMVVQPDRRRGQLTGDYLGNTFAAWPKGRGAGKQLASWVTTHEHGQGRRVTGSALPWIAPRYLRAGYIKDGHTLWFMTRVASRPRPTGPVR